MNDCNIARISSFRLSVVLATDRIASKAVLSVFDVATPSSTPLRPIWFHAARRCSVRAVGGPYRLVTRLTDGDLTAWPALTAEADADCAVQQHGPGDGGGYPDFPEGHGGTASAGR